LTHFFARFLRLSALGLCALLFAGVVSQAHAYPERSIHLVVPNAAGGGTDAFARIMAQKLGEVLRQKTGAHSLKHKNQ
jgi:tripartite-type tricarboxylate transporter receptor subunit TctC